MTKISNASRGDFNVLKKPQNGRGPTTPKKPHGEEPINPHGGDTDYGDDDGKITVRITNRGIGATLTAEESKKLQEELGVPVELPKDGDEDKYAQEAKKHAGKLSTGTVGSGKGSLRRAIARLSTKPRLVECQLEGC